MRGQTERPGFQEFVGYCLAVGIGLTIVSSGLDFYIKAVLDKIDAHKTNNW